MQARSMPPLSWRVVRLRGLCVAVICLLALQCLAIDDPEAPEDKTPWKNYDDSYEPGGTDRGWEAPSSFNEWQSVEVFAGRPKPAFGSTATYIGSEKVVIYGGTYSEVVTHTLGRSNDDVEPFHNHRSVWVYYLYQHKWLYGHALDHSQRRSFHSATSSLPGLSYFYVFGGLKQGLPVTLSNDVIKASDTYAAFVRVVSKDKPAPRILAGLELLRLPNGKECMFMFGGTDTKTIFDDTWLFDPVRGVWSKVPKSNSTNWPEGRFSPGVARRPGDMSVSMTGGCLQGYDACIRDLGGPDSQGFWRFDVTDNSCTTGQWTLEFSVAAPRGSGVYGSQSMAYYKGTPYFFGVSQTNSTSTAFHSLEVDANSNRAFWSKAEVNRASPLPPLRLGMALCITPNGIFLFGGYTYLAVLQDSWLFMPDSGLWIYTHSDIESNRLVGATSATVLSTVFLFGGMTVDGQVSNALWLFDQTLLRWLPLQTGTDPGARRLHTLSVLNDRHLVLFGGTRNGWKDAHPPNKVWAIDAARLLNGTASDWELVLRAKQVSMPGASDETVTGRAGHTTVIHDGRLVVMGGWLRVDTFEFRDTEVTNDVSVGQFVECTAGLCIDWKTNVAEGSQKTPEKRAGHIAMLLSDEALKHTSMVIYGGQNGGLDILNDMWLLDLDSYRWRQLELVSTSDGPPAGFMPNIFNLGYGAYAVYGGVENQDDPIADGHLYVGRLADQNNWQWLNIELNNGTEPRFGAASAMIQNTLLLIGGGTLEHGIINSLDTAVALLVGCNPGSSSPSFPATPCTLCEPGTYQNTPGQKKCVPCPGASYSANPGAKSITSCNLCEQGHCAHGTCALDSDMSAVCRCHPGWSGSVCNIHAAGIAAGVIVSLLIIVMVAVAWRQLMRRKVRDLKQYSELQEGLISTAQHELDQLKKVWEIDANELHFSRRVDKGSEGAFGEVWLAHWQDRQVAVKKLKVSVYMMDQEAQEEFELEVSVLRSIRHRHIVFFYGAGTSDGVPFLVTEFMARGSLRVNLSKKDVDLPYWRKLAFARDAADGMAFLHGLSPPHIHRDLKSANLLVSEAWIVKVSDFGTARLMSQLRKSAKVVEYKRQTTVRIPTDVLMMTANKGTLLWQAPEVLEGSHNYGAPADVYSFGITLWEIYTRKVPYDQEFAGGPWEIRDAVMRGERPPVSSSCPEDYAALMKQCWAQDPMDRPTFNEVLDRIMLILRRTMGSVSSNHDESNL